MKNVSKHAKKRIKQRGNSAINLNNGALVKNAKKNGVEMNIYSKDFGETPLVKFAQRKMTNHKYARIYFYLDYIMVFTQNLNKLITLYPMLDQYKGEVATNYLRKKLNLLGTEENINLIKENGEWKITIYEDKNTHTVCFFDKLIDARKYLMEYFISKPLCIKYFKKNKEATQKDFISFLLEMKYATIDKNFIKSENFTQECFEEMFLQEENVLRKNILIKRENKEDEEQNIFELFVLNNDNYISVGKFKNKRNAINFLVKHYENTVWYEHFLSSKALEYSDKTYKGFYRFAIDLGLGIILNKKYNDILKKLQKDA